MVLIISIIIVIFLAFIFHCNLLQVHFTLKVAEATAETCLL